MWLFLDTEWADPAGNDLVSLALVSEDGIQRFYAEVAELPSCPTSFVKEVVYPLLERGDSALTPTQLARALRLFVAKIDQPELVFDYPRDAILLRKALGEPAEENLGPYPALGFNLLRSVPVSTAIERYFETHPEAAARRHHAGVDAEALRWAVFSNLGGRSFA